jgi:hypothetical protein
LVVCKIIEKFSSLHCCKEISLWSMSPL